MWIPTVRRWLSCLLESNKIKRLPLIVQKKTAESKRKRMPILCVCVWFRSREAAPGVPFGSTHSIHEGHRSKSHSGRSWLRHQKWRDASIPFPHSTTMENRRSCSWKQQLQSSLSLFSITVVLISTYPTWIYIISLQKENVELLLYTTISARHDETNLPPP